MRARARLQNRDSAQDARRPGHKVHLGFESARVTKRKPSKKAKERCSSTGITTRKVPRGFLQRQNLTSHTRNQLSAAPLARLLYGKHLFLDLLLNGLTSMQVWGVGGR